MNDKELFILVTTTVFLFIISYLYYKKKTRFKIGLYILLVYTLSSIMSIVYVFQPYSWSYLNGKSQWWPIIYWMFVFFLTCIPIFNFDKTKVTHIEYDNDFLIKICKFGFFISIIPFSEQLFSASHLFLGGNDFGQMALSLHDDNDGLENLSLLSRLLLKVNIAIYDLSFLMLLVFFMQKKKNNFALFCIIFIIATRNLTGLIVGHRSSFIEVLQKLILITLIALPLVDKVKRKKILKIVSISFAVFLGFFLIITIGRSLAYNEHDSEFTLIAFLSRYMGEQFLLFNEYLPSMKTTLGGEITCWYFLDILGLNPHELTRDYYYITLTRLQGIQQNVFYSYIGNFVQDFGFIITALILPLISMIFAKLTKVRGNTIPLSTLFLFVFYTSIILQGVTSFCYNGTHGKFIIFSFIIYFILKHVELKKRTLCK